MRYPVQVKYPRADFKVVARSMGKVEQPTVSLVSADRLDEPWSFAFTRRT